MIDTAKQPSRCDMLSSRSESSVDSVPAFLSLKERQVSFVQLGAFRVSAALASRNAGLGVRQIVAPPKKHSIPSFPQFLKHRLSISKLIRRGLHLDKLCRMISNQISLHFNGNPLYERIKGFLAKQLRGANQFKVANQTMGANQFEASGMNPSYVPMSLKEHKQMSYSTHCQCDRRVEDHFSGNEKAHEILVENQFRMAQVI